MASTPSSTAPPPSTSTTTTPDPGSTSTAGISTRDYIYLLPYPLPLGTPVPYTTGLPSNNPLGLAECPAEPTSTLVLTSPKSTFLDIRVNRPMHEGEDELPNDGNPHNNRLEWAFAGTSRSRPISEEEIEEKGLPFNQPTPVHPDMFDGISYSHWYHWLDSRFPVGDEERIPKDEGCMYTLATTSPSGPNPHSTLTLEFGIGEYPRVGLVAQIADAYQVGESSEKPRVGGIPMHHEEMWRDLPILSLPSSSSSFPAGSRKCVVLRIDEAKVGVKGIVIRLGQYCQGFIKTNSANTIERWEFREQFSKSTSAVDKDKEEVVGGDWVRVVRMGDSFLPCAVAMKGEVEEGTKIEYKGMNWVVEEVAEW